MSDSPYRDVPPNRWTGLYNAARAIDDTLTGIGGTMFLLGSRGLLWAAQAAADRRVTRDEARADRRARSRWVRTLEAWDDAVCAGSDGICGDDDAD